MHARQRWRFSALELDSQLHNLCRSWPQPQHADGTSRAASQLVEETLQLSSRRRLLPEGSAFSSTFARKADPCLLQAGLAALGMTPSALFPQTVQPL